MSSEEELPDLNTTDTELFDGLGFLEEDPVNGSAAFGEWLELDSDSESDQPEENIPVASTPNSDDVLFELENNIASSPLFKDRTYVLSSNSLEDPPSYYETNSFRTLQDQINEIMTSGVHSSSQTMSEELCPLLLAQNAHLQSLLRQKESAGLKKTEKHLDMAAEGIREQSQVLGQYQESNEKLLSQQKELHKEIERSFQEICSDRVPGDSDVFEPTQNSIIDQFHCFAKTCQSIIQQQDNEILSLRSRSVTEDSDVCKTSTNGLTTLKEDFYSSEESSEESQSVEVESTRSFLQENQDKILQWMEEHQFQSLKLQDISQENQKVAKALSSLLEEASRAKVPSLEGENGLEYIKPAEEEIEDLAKQSLFIQSQISEMIYSHRSFDWCIVLAKGIQFVNEENIKLQEKYQNLLQENTSLLNHAEELVEESNGHIQLIDALQREVASYHTRRKVVESPDESGESPNPEQEERHARAMSLIEKIRNIHGNNAVLISAEVFTPLNRAPVQGTTIEENNSSEEDEESTSVHDTDTTWHQSMVELQKYKEEYKEALEQLAAANTEIRYWRDLAESTKVKLARLLEECSCSPVKDLAGEFGSSEDEILNFGSSDSSVVSSFQAEIATLTSIVKNLTESNESLTGEREKLIEQVRALTQNLQEMEATANKQKLSIQAMTKRLATQQVNSSSDLLSQKQNVIQKLCQQREELATQLKRLKQQLESVEEEKHLLQENLQFYNSKQSFATSPSPSSSFQNADDYGSALQEMEAENSLCDIALLRSRLTETLKQNKLLLETRIGVSELKEAQEQQKHALEQIEQLLQQIRLLFGSNNEANDIVNQIEVLVKGFPGLLFNSL